MAMGMAMEMNREAPNASDVPSPHMLFAGKAVPASASWLTKAAIVLSACFVMGIAAASAQCGITQSCPSTTPGIFPTITTICPSNICLRDTQIREKYERENNCIFPDSSLCGGKKVDADTQCCIKDARTNKSRIRQKQYTSLDKSFDWNAYRQECEDMQQSEAPPDALWKQCVVGQPHSDKDNYPVMKVETNGKARSYCIDGCSTPRSLTEMRCIFEELSIHPRPIHPDQS